MKLSIKQFASAVALIAVVAGPAFATVPSSNVQRDVNSVIGSESNIFISVNNQVATFSGYFKDAGDRGAALQAALASPSVKRVINLATVSN